MMRGGDLCDDAKRAKRRRCSLSREHPALHIRTQQRPEAELGCGRMRSDGVVGFCPICLLQNAKVVEDVDALRFARCLVRVSLRQAVFVRFCLGAIG